MLATTNDTYTAMRYWHDDLCYVCVCVCICVCGVLCFDTDYIDGQTVLSINARRTRRFYIILLLYDLYYYTHAC